MGEHVGQDNYPVYAAQLHRLLRPQGRLLLQQMSRGAAGANTAPGGGAFMERYVAPDMYMRPLGSTLNFLEAAGLEVVDVHSLREHYVWTVRPWLDTLQDDQAEAIAADRRRAVPGVAALPGRGGAGVRGEPDGRAPDPGGPPGRRGPLRAAPRAQLAPWAATRSWTAAGDTGRATARRAALADRHDDPRERAYPWSAALTNLAVTAAVVLLTFAGGAVRGGAGARRPARRHRHRVGRRLRDHRADHAAAGRRRRRPLAAAADHRADLRVGAAAGLAHQPAQPGHRRGPAVRRDHRQGAGATRCCTWSARSTCRRR